MASDEEAQSLSHDEGFGELVCRIKIGDQTAYHDLRSMVTAGIEFLLRRRLAKVDVSAEATAVIESTVRAIHTSRSSELLNLPGLIISIIHSQFPSSVATNETSSPDSSALKAAQSALAEMSPLEQGILRQYYTLGATPKAIQSRLHVGSQTVRKTLVKARSLFFRRAAGS